MDPEKPDIQISDVVISVRGRDQGEIFYVVGREEEFLLLANGKNRTLEEPKRKKQKHVEKVLRSETRVAAKLLSGDKVLNGELRRDLAFLSRGMQANDLGG
ncbi:MAG: KOW domain-containing RNA-binding protein [Candidatus Faecousia sp.]|nr:KOW domain-containing RNA-binding protein [Bacillota bacterium]MDY4755022.1 KOW domain-containing RNA-binding protein [Candidatus Faecousia sp.]MDY6160846.1 KOW domain-containing RNA-binding protein [Candidatus Faecousia sp.]